MAGMTRGRYSLSVLATKGLESVGLFNKGSAAIARGEVLEEQLAVVSPSLNVTRVSGFAALIASGGAAILGVLNVDKSEDSAGVVAAAYGSVGLVVAASLIAAAVILSADIRARMAGPAAATAASTSAATDGASAPADVSRTWHAALQGLTTMKSGLQGTSGRLGYSELWLDASGTTGLVSDLSPGGDLSDHHARLLAAQGRIVELLEGLIGSQSDETDDVREIEQLVTEMQKTLGHLPSHPPATS